MALPTALQTKSPLPGRQRSKTGATGASGHCEAYARLLVDITSDCSTLGRLDVSTSEQNTPVWQSRRDIHVSGG